VVALLERMYEPSSGRILVDDVDISQIEITAYRQSIALVGQNPKLFDASVADNIAYGLTPRPGDVCHKHVVVLSAHFVQSTIKQAAERAHAKFISELPNQFETRVGVGGEKLSGGQVSRPLPVLVLLIMRSQRQRIAIARAIVREEQTRILLLDEVWFLLA
jgi:ABC-type multidrug transport system fused ATPase/permease subunit